MDEAILARMNDAQNRKRVLEEFNASTLDLVGPIGVYEGMTVLEESNDFQAGHDEFVKSLAPTVDGR